MKRTLIGLMLIALVLFGSAASLTTAAPALQTTPVTAATWGVGALVRVKASVPFAWVRATPSTMGTTRGTALTGDYLVIASGSPLWDGVQWWWNVRWGNITGYVEQQSLELVIQGATPVPTTVPMTPTPVPSPVPTTVPPAGNPPFTAGNQLQITPSLPFVWLRSGPSSTAAVVDIAYPNSILVVVAGQNSRAWDGVQWWDWVARMGVAATGWVEENRVQLASTSPTPLPPTPTPIAVGPTPTAVPTGSTAAAWAFGSFHSVKSGLPFAWIRTAPSSVADAASTLYSGWLVLIVNSTPSWDGVQWWWKVYQPARNVQGWIEQNSLQ